MDYSNKLEIFWNNALQGETSKLPVVLSKKLQNSANNHTKPCVLIIFTISQKL